MDTQKWKSVFILFIAVIGLTQWPSPPIAASTSGDPAAGFIQDMGDEVISYISDPALSKEQKKQKLEQSLNQNFDIYTIGRFTLGPYWKQLTANQQTEYLALYEDMIVAIYANRFSHYQGETFQVSGTQPYDSSDSIIKSFIITPKSQENISVTWHIRLKNDEFRIIDVAIENVSMIITQKENFASAIQRKGGNPVVILDYLREKNANQNME